MDATRRAQLQKQAEAVRTGGKGTVRRKVKAQRKQQGGGDEKRTIAALKGLGLQPIQGAEEVHMVREDGQVLLFKNPKVQAAVQANTFVVTGNSELKPAGFGESFSMADIEKLKKAMASQVNAGAETAEDDDVPDLVSADVNFEQVATK